jgi:hypothetical protein
VVSKKVKIYTMPYKDMNFLRWQHASFKKHIKDDYELIVLNCPNDDEVDQLIKTECESIGLQRLDLFKRDFKSGNYYVATGLQEAIDRFVSKDKECISIMLDTDMFALADFSFNAYLEGWDFAGLSQSRLGANHFVEYVFNGFMMFTPTMPDLEYFDVGCGAIWDCFCDCGGMSYFYFRSHPQLKWRRSQNTGQIVRDSEGMKHLPEELRDEYVDEFRLDVIEKAFVHYKASSNWDYQTDDYHNRKQEFVKKLIQL